MRNFLILLACLATAKLLAATPPQYNYGDCWWEEYPGDAGAELLLHFGVPQPTARQLLATELAATIKQERLETDLIDLDELDHRPTALGGIELGPPIAERGPTIDEASLPVGTVLDYGRTERTLTLPAGQQVVADGRFGGGLRCAGDAPLKARIENAVCVESWVRVDSLPAATQCILAVGEDDCRLLLHPDGRLELKLKRGHGLPGAYPGLKEPMSEEAKALIFAKDATIMSPDPVAAGEWFHVAIWNRPHPTPGGGEPWEAVLKINGSDVAWYQSERYNINPWLGGRQAELALGNSAAGDQPFVGLLDDVRVSSRQRQHYERPELPWRDSAATRELQFDKPWFRQDGTLLHASFEQGLAVDRPADRQVQLDLRNLGVDRLLTPGVRGKALTVEPAVGFPRLPLPGLTTAAGSLEFWLRPVNWDDMTGYWQHTPPRQMHLSVLRLYGQEAGQENAPLLSAALPRAYNLERSRIPVDPGHWLHLVLVWGGQEQGADAALYVNGRHHGRLRWSRGIAAATELAWAEFGVNDDVVVANRERPVVEIDEVVAYGYPLQEDEIAQAARRWQGPLEPLKLYRQRIDYKYSVRRLNVELIPMLPPGVQATTAEATLRSTHLDDGGEPFVRHLSADLAGDRFRFPLVDGDPLPTGKYTVSFVARSAVGDELLRDDLEWEHRRKPWRDFAGGLGVVPPPWQPLRVEGDRLEATVSSYTLGNHGLPTQIHAGNRDLLAAPIRLLEDGTELVGTATAFERQDADAVEWRASFAGRTCQPEIACRLEFDGMLRFEIRPRPTAGGLAPLTLVMPVRSEIAKRLIYYPMGARGVSVGTVPEADGVALESRTPQVGNQHRQEFQQRRKNEPELSWETYWQEVKAKTEAYGFFGHFGVNDLDRGLWWFADNAAGWVQSKTKSAIELVRQGDQLLIVLNLVAEAVDEYDGSRPILFGLLPHPARPLPEKYRLYERIPASEDNLASSIYDAFRPWPRDPRHNGMQLFPAADPRNRAAGPSWEYAESCIPYIKSAKPTGYRTMYLSRLWFSCRAGSYDGWEWRSGATSGTSLTPYFINYLCWEMNEWIGRDIFDAIYLDECYETPARNLEAGFSVRLPDGSEQPGLSNFQFRELMKRWRGIFTQHGKTPMLIGHHTLSWQYHGLVFCDSTLDGENHPIVSLNSRDWIDSTWITRFEALQNGRLWGLATFYMPFIAEGGFANKEVSQYPRWQWRMARQAQSMFAHYETATVYEGQGSQVYKDYWRDVLEWGAKRREVAFHPYWEADSGVLATTEAGQPSDNLLASFYRDQQRLLIIVSNRSKEAQVATVTIDRQRFGLPATFAARSLDRGLKPAAGDDFHGAAAVRQATAELLEATASNLLGAGSPSQLGLDDGLGELDDPTEAAETELAITRHGDAILVPLRPRDFRLIAIE